MQMTVQHYLQGPSGNAEDRYTNTFHLNNGDGEPPVFEAIAAAINGFFVSLSGTILSGACIGPNSVIKIYDKQDIPPRVPLYTEVFPALSGGLGNLNLPNEVAICLSYATTFTSGVNNARRRGRMYLGPLNIGATDGAGGAEARPKATAVASTLGFVQTLLTQLEAQSVDWVMYSKTANTTGVINEFWIDNAFDTQRRRGVDSTNRTVLIPA
jgi:hypothetical protein